MSAGAEAFGRFSVVAAAADATDDPALITPDRSWTWSELAASALREGERLAATGAFATPGDRVAFDAVPTPATIVRLLALMEVGACAVPLHPRLPPAARQARLRALAPCRDADAEDAAAVVDAGERLRWLPRPGAEETLPLAVLFTSGSGGAPRAVELPRTAFAASADASAEHLGWHEADRWLCCLPLAHVGGLSIVTRCLAARRPVVLSGAFDPGRVRLALDRQGVTLASFVPTMLYRLFDDAPAWRPPPTLRACLLGGAAAGDGLWDEIARRDVPALSTYGMTETCSQVATARPGTRPEARRRPVPLRGVDMRIRDGQIEVAGPMLCSRIATLRTSENDWPGGEAADGPWTDDGFLRTGDVGRLVGGALVVTGRADGGIVTGGENVSPAEVEAVLRRHPAVRRAVVFGLPDDEWGEIVTAVLERRSARSTPAARELTEWLEERLAPHQLPRRLAWTSELPETAGGKVDRRAVREAWARVRTDDPDEAGTTTGPGSEA